MKLQNATRLTKVRLQEISPITAYTVKFSCRAYLFVTCFLHTKSTRNRRNSKICIKRTHLSQTIEFCQNGMECHKT